MATGAARRVEINQPPGGAIRQKRGERQMVQLVAAAHRAERAEQRQAGQSEIADRIRILIEQTAFTSAQTGENYGPITISMGLCMATEADGPEDLYAKADRALYRSKVKGRNRVTRHSATTADKSGKNWLLYRSE